MPVGAAPQAVQASRSSVTPAGVRIFRPLSSWRLEKGLEEMVCRVPCCQLVEMTRTPVWLS